MIAAIAVMSWEAPTSIKWWEHVTNGAIAYAQTISTGELVDKSVFYRNCILDRIRSLSEEAVDRDYIDGDGNVFNIVQYLRDFIWHDRHHMTQLKERLGLE